jgi:hypothetical protein
MIGGNRTPAPWFMRLSDNATPLIEFGPISETGNLDYLICAMPAEITRTFNSYANARLIAAAPDLLDALKRLESATRILPPDMDEPDSPLAQARAAIAKAEGGAA